MLSKSSCLATFLGNYQLNKHKQWLTVLGALKPGHLEDDCPMKTLSEKKRFSSSFFYKQNNKIQVFNYANVENFKTIWTYLTFQETTLKFYKCYSSVCKKNIENLLTTIFFGKRKTGVPGEKPLGARERTSNKLIPHMKSTLGFKP